MTSQTIAQTIKACASVLDNHDGSLTFNEPSLEAKILVGHCVKKTFSQLIVDANEYIHADIQLNIKRCIERRLAGEPIAYIIGHQPFWTLDLDVSEHTLIPRSDTETLIETVMNLPIADDASGGDLGTGTGAIALSLASEKPNWQVLGIDFKQEIIELARRNALKNGLKTTFLQSDWYHALNGLRFDLIVSNPPYVESDSPYLNQGDLRFEPRSALTSGDHGLADIKTIITQGKMHLKKGAYMVLEHGATQAMPITKIFLEQGYSQISTIADINGLDRVTLAVFDKPL